MLKLPAERAIVDPRHPAHLVRKQRPEPLELRLTQLILS